MLNSCVWRQLHLVVGGGAHGLHSICAGRGASATQHEAPTTCSQTQQDVIAPARFHLAHLDVSSCLPCRAYALRDYYPFWKSHQERSTAGQALSADGLHAAALHAAAQAAAAEL